MTNLNELAESIHEANKAKGFWDRERPLTETTMLIVTELGEAVEEERAGNAGLYYLDTETNEVVLADDAYGHWDGLVRSKARASGPLKPEGVDVELIDALIRLLDLLGARGTDVERLLEQKLAYNRAGRGHRHGKAY